MLYTEKPAAFNPKLIVTSCFVEHDGHILLLQRHPDKPQGGTWGMPAGKVEKDEELPEATQRETREETGITLPHFELTNPVETFVRWDDFDFVYYMFRVLLDEKPEIVIDSSAHTAYQWATPHDALNLKLIQDLDACIKLVYFPDQFDQQD